MMQGPNSDSCWLAMSTVVLILVFLRGGATSTTAPSSMATTTTQPECKPNCISCTSETECGSCEDGFYGNDCSKACIQNCSSCTDDKSCTVCKDGYFGETCDGVCNVECVSCLTKTNCRGRCKPRSYGIHCLDNCPTYCQTCVSDTNCTGCRTNTFNANDVSTCSCSIVECTRTSKFGTCESCNNITWYPTWRGCCECGLNCVNRKCNELGHCIDECEPGYYGDRCNILCSSIDDNCTRCQGFSEDTYRCTTCSDGFYPDVNTSQCIPCSDTCNDSTSTEPPCNSSNGRCNFGCKSQYLGERCHLLCSTDCSQCSDIAVCLLCNDGFYLHPVDNTVCLPCGQGCHNTSEPNAATCSHSDGSCLNGCITGYFGSKCDNNCSQRCKGGSCSENGSCDQGCENGWFGKNCKNRCYITCLDGLCRADTGNCIMGCKDAAYYGDFCQTNCSVNCLEGYCSRNGTCAQGCENGWFGTNCENRCYITCLDGLCRADTGVCIMGCKDAAYGDFCQTNCSVNCLEGYCSRNGTCFNGCIDGYLGDTCDINMDTTPTRTTEPYWIVAIIAGVVGLGLMTLFIIHKSRRCKTWWIRHAHVHY